MQKELKGIILVDKPSGITSHDVVDIVRKRLKIKKVGHGGTLDPLATGLLIILVGKATKLFSKFSSFDKGYEATLKLGVSTTTGDSQGDVLGECAYEHISLDRIKEAFKDFEGEILQTPPQVCALRYKGKRLYDLARKGQIVELAPRRIKIHSLEIKDMNLPEIDFYIYCSKGTYVRKIAQDIGEVLGCGAYVTRIRRTKIGPFLLKDSLDPYKIDEDSLIRKIPEI
ncbi:MAG: tRNA pseudouridine(55) synthase TruB [Candidatus Omnitrophica bacterium]|nr:tRNA pseudouridine(55) synthase TruB [Candidatus Omnitrophota bacterium]